MNKERLPLSVIIPAKNEEDRIWRTLDSVAFADDILVVDSFSTDNTVQIARDKGARVIQQEYRYSASQKNRSIPLAFHEWILLLDADEWIDSDLQNEIQEMLREGSMDSMDSMAYRIPRINYYMDKRIKYSGWQNDRVIRLFHRDKCRYEDKRVHAKIETSGRIGRLSSPIHHNTYRNFNDVLKKVHQYSTWKAIDKVEKGKKASAASLLYLPLHAFIKTYFLRGGILDGRVGYILSVIAAGSAFLRQVKIWRIRQGEKMN
jgi:glycosyltransferase involved in cell wall biosynthesis